MPVVPHSRRGCWAVGLVLIVVFYPAYWVLLNNSSLPDSWVPFVAAVIGVPPLIFGLVALLRREARSWLLTALLVLAVLEVGFGLFVASQL
jgi:hypothetical protein